MKVRFSGQQLAHIIDQALIYQCACPAQVCQALIGLHDLYEYQRECLESTDTDRAVHQRIAEAARECHQSMEACLLEILRLEEWDMATLTMPDSLRKRTAKEGL